MRASDIVEPAPTVSEDATVLDAIRLVAVEGQPGVVVVAADGRLRAVLPASQVMRLLIPGYVRDDLSLARMWDEAHADDLARVLASTALREVMPAYREVPTVDADATLMEVAAVMAAERTPLVPVIAADGILGVVTAGGLLRAALAR